MLTKKEDTPDPDATDAVTMKEDTPDPDATADAAEDTQEEGVTLEIPPAKETAASLLRKRNNTRRTLTRYDLDGDGIIDPEEAQLMAQDLNAANEQVDVVEKDKNSKYSTLTSYEYPRRGCSLVCLCLYIM
jgi:hypothetical protein